MQSWKNLGEVTIAYSNGKTWAFRSLEDACRYIGLHSIRHLEFGFLRKNYEDIITRCRLSLSLLGTGDPYVFIDEMGLVIPVWKVKEVARQVCGRIPRRHYRHRVGVRSDRLPRWRAVYRKPSFIGERKSDCCDMLVEYDIAVTRKRIYICPYDSYGYRSDRKVRSWKKNRSHQWKERSQ